MNGTVVVSGLYAQLQESSKPLLENLQGSHQMCECTTSIAYIYAYVYFILYTMTFSDEAEKF